MARNPSDNSTHWLVMLPAGKIIGPYTSDAVLKLIREGAANEDCRIKKMGTGTWYSLSKEPQFFDAILEAMNNPASNAANPNIQAENFFSETIIQKAPQSAEATRISGSMVANQNDEMTVPGVSGVDPNAPPDVINAPQVKPQAKPEKKSDPNVLELANLGQVARQEKIKNSKGPMALVVGAIVLAIAAFFIDTGPGAEELQLILPNLSKPPVAQYDTKLVEATFNKARQYFWVDTVEGYLQSQAQLVNLIEAVPQYMPARGMLCQVYRELWPHVRQSNGDMEIVNKLYKSTRSLDPTGPAGAYCEVTRLLIQGRTNEAVGVVGYFLEVWDRDNIEYLREMESKGKPAHRFSEDPIMMSFRAELLASVREDGGTRIDLGTAAAYTQNIQQRVPYWVKMYYLQARFLMQAGRPQDAAQAFEKTLKLNPNHKPSLIEFGIMNYTQFRQSDKALNYITGALSARGIVTRSLESRANYTLAKIFGERRDLSEALRYAQKAYELNPGDSMTKNLVVELGGNVKLSDSAARNNTLVLEGDQHEREGDCLMAQGLYKSAFEADPQNAPAAMKAGKCLKQLNRPREAVSWLTKAIKADPKFTTPYLLLADYYSEAYDFRRAEGILNQAAQRFPNHYEILRGYGLLSYRQLRNKAAIGYLTRALKGYEGDIETLILLAKVYLQDQDYQQALNFATRALELDRSNVEAHIVYGRTLAPFKGLDAAITYLRDQRQQFSKNVEYPLAIAELYRDTGRCAIAEQEFKTVIEWKPQTKAAYVGLAECYYLAGSIREAVKSFYEAAYYDPSDAEPFVRIGMVYISANRYGDALPLLKRALTVNEMKPLVRYYLGKAYFGTGDYKAALDWAMQEAAQNPKLAEPYILAAEVHAATGAYKECADQYQRAVGLRTANRAELYVNMAQCQRQSQNLDGAQGSLDIAISLESGRPEIYREQGALFELRGDLRAAAAAYNKYLTLSPNAPDRVGVETQLNRLGGAPE